MNCIYICKECGYIGKFDTSKGTINLYCKSCGSKIDWDNSYPPLNAQDFYLSVLELLDNAKICDNENLELQHEYLEKSRYEIDITSLDKYNNLFEKIYEKHPDNDDSVWSEMTDKFEEMLCKEIDIEFANAIISAIMVSHRNKFRKPYVIMLASFIEQLFNDYFNNIVFTFLPSNGARIFLKKYTTAGIQVTLDITDSFFDESIKSKMDKYSKGYYDRWANLRNLRNSIIHSNNVYISKIKVSQINKLVNESLMVFSNLNSELIIMQASASK